MVFILKICDYFPGDLKFSSIIINDDLMCFHLAIKLPKGHMVRLVLQLSERCFNDDDVVVSNLKKKQ